LSEHYLETIKITLNTKQIKRYQLHPRKCSHATEKQASTKLKFR